MKIAIIGSSQYYSWFLRYAEKLRNEGHEVMLPTLDSDQTARGINLCKANRSMIVWADEVHVFWDQRSTGTIWDMGMAYGLEKPIKIAYLEKETIGKAIWEYATSGKVSA